MQGKRFVQRNRRYAFMVTKLEDAERGTRLGRRGADGRLEWLRRWVVLLSSPPHPSLLHLLPNPLQSPTSFFAHLAICLAFNAHLRRSFFARLR